MTQSALLRDVAEQIWRAGVRAVDSQALIEQAIQCRGDQLVVCGESWSLAGLRRIIVVGGGKAGAGMAAGVEQALGPEVAAEKLTGWVNVPADCVRALDRIHLHPARPAGCNEPRPEGVEGAEQILAMAGDVGPFDLCLVLLSGGGSALLPAPRGIDLPAKLAVTRLLSRRGADIHELNTVRQCLSRIKGGGLLRAGGGGPVRTLIISDVIGDPIDIIASGPTSTAPLRPAIAREILQRYAQSADDVPESVWRALDALQAAPPAAIDPKSVRNTIIGNNRSAIDAAAVAAAALGCEVRILATDEAGFASDAGRRLAIAVREIQREIAGTGRRICGLSGGEPVVALTPTELPRSGGRNQELVLAAWEQLAAEGCRGLALLSGGTDGEDGPTDAAGALLDEEIAARITALGLDAGAFLAINNSYEFFARVDGLLKTGPTHTNVMDLRVAVIVEPVAPSATSS